MKRLNKKGFTLVELLAVIVVLAIIMVIATQAIGNVIQKNTVSSFKSSLDMVVKQAKQADVMATGSLALEDVEKLVDYDPAQYTISLEKETEDDDYEKLVCITAKDGGKFENMNDDYLDDLTGVTYNDDSSNAKLCKKFRN